MKAILPPSHSEDKHKKKRREAVKQKITLRKKHLSQGLLNETETAREQEIAAAKRKKKARQKAQKRQLNHSITPQTPQDPSDV
jgi:hypothetical protein